MRNSSQWVMLLTKFLASPSLDCLLSHAENRLLLRDMTLIGSVLAVAELALGLVRLEGGALTEALVAEFANVGALPGMGPVKSAKC